MATYTCRDCDYFWDKTDFDSGKGRIAYSSPADGIKEGDVVCEDCYEEAEEEEEEREFPFFVSVAYFPDTNHRAEREVGEFKTMEEAKVCFDAVVVELKNHNDPRVVTLEKWELGDNGAEVLESEDFNDEEEDKAYVVKDITFDYNEDEDDKMTEEDWEALKQEVYTTTWFALNEDDLCDQISDKTGWLVAGFGCEEIC